MAVAILILLLFLEPILSDNNLSWEEYRKLNLVKKMTMKETRYRRKIYLENLAKIKEHNDKFRKGLVTYSLAMNAFGHLTEKEFLNKYTDGSYDRDKKKLKFHSLIYSAPKNIKLPESVDWRLKGVVTQVKSQRGCGACYAFGSKTYYTKELTAAEEKLRKKIYLENLAKIQEHNDKFRKGLVSYRLKVNEFQHLTDDEFDGIYSGTKHSDDEIKKLYNGFYEAPKKATIPEAMNWKDQGAVTEVKAQNECGSCYAFGVVGALESLYYIKHKKLVEFSEQQIVDCGKSHGLNGCKGGTVAKTFKYARDVGLTEQAEYPYEAVTGPCRIEDLPILVKAASYKYINNYAIRDMEAAIGFNGPVIANLMSAPIRALAGTDIFTGDTCTERKEKNHAVVVVGYNTTAEGQKYWIIKNNWGTRWGDNGYFYVDRKPEDPCGLTFGAYVAYIQ